MSPSSEKKVCADVTKVRTLRSGVLSGLPRWTLNPMINVLIRMSQREMGHAYTEEKAT